MKQDEQDAILAALEVKFIVNLITLCFSLIHTFTHFHEPYAAETSNDSPKERSLLFNYKIVIIQKQNHVKHDWNDFLSFAVPAKSSETKQ